ncbi:response regulator transcription factor [Vibrio ulleungensis]|uniref:Response regulator transcription factor n=1 Tax=Vibrio ulleungensis TaxID=2807619 RepID=A0ABS2HD92_9VIBR|nr:response regulator transcription factor [Vibrio ulleungensis]MBM7035563.1 response regulator transcription factor [Vibrio ulleungensis]
MTQINCLIIDDHPLVCVAIKALITELPSVASVFTTTKAVEAQSLIDKHGINLIVLDVNLGDHDGFDFMRRLSSKGYRGKVLFFSAEGSPMFSELAFKLGADGYVCKAESHNILKDAVASIANGYTFFKFKSKRHQTQDDTMLSQREAVVMNHLLQGRSNREIASILSISEKTVSTYKKRILDKYSVSNLVELSRATAL